MSSEVGEVPVLLGLGRRGLGVRRTWSGFLLRRARILSRDQAAPLPFAKPHTLRGLHLPDPKPSSRASVIREHPHLARLCLRLCHLQKLIWTFFVFMGVDFLFCFIYLFECCGLFGFDEIKKKRKKKISCLKNKIITSNPCLFCIIFGVEAHR